MTFAHATRLALSRVTDYASRSRRAEFWWYVLFFAIVDAALGLGFLVLFWLGSGFTADGVRPAFAPVLLGAGIALGLVNLFLLVPYVAVGARRLHDLGMSAWWLLLVVVPVGSLVLLGFLALPGRVGANRYGPDPLATPHPEP